MDVDEAAQIRECWPAGNKQKCKTRVGFLRKTTNGLQDCTWRTGKQFNDEKNLCEEDGYNPWVPSSIVS